jgi:hypothetical protein
MHLKRFVELASLAQYVADRTKRTDPSRRIEVGSPKLQCLPVEVERAILIAE